MYYNIPVNVTQFYTPIYNRVVVLQIGRLLPCKSERTCDDRVYTRMVRFFWENIVVLSSVFLAAKYYDIVFLCMSFETWSALVLSKMLAEL